MLPETQRSENRGPFVTATMRRGPEVIHGKVGSVSVITTFIELTRNEGRNDRTSISGADMSSNDEFTKCRQGSIKLAMKAR